MKELPKIRKEDRCGYCHTCLNPHLKKPCKTRRDEVSRGVTACLALVWYGIYWDIWYIFGISGIYQRDAATTCLEGLTNRPSIWSSTQSSSALLVSATGAQC